MFLHIKITNEGVFYRDNETYNWFHKNLCEYYGGVSNPRFHHRQPADSVEGCFIESFAITQE